MSSTSAIIFIKCRNRQHMKNNIRYKGNTTNTSVIIFLKKSKTPSDVTLLGRNSSEVFVMLVVVVSSFCCCIFICWCSSFCGCSSFTFSFWRHPSPFRGLSPRFLYPILYFLPRPSQSDLWHFHFQSFLYLLAARVTVLSGHFLPTGISYLMLLHWHFNLRLSRFPWEPAVLSWSLHGFILILETQTRPICLFDSQ